MKRLILLPLAFVFTLAYSQDNKLDKSIRKEYKSLEKLYIHLHTHPELSFEEVETSKRMAEELKKEGFEVTEKVGGHGVVGLLKNGEGPTIMVRADMDALPLKEKTNLPYASTVSAKNEDGMEVYAMHACGHDVHMTVWVGTARMLARNKDQWKGTLIMVGQPAEERAGGAKAMLNDELYSKFPKPDQCLALHVNANLPAGKVGVKKGYALASVDMVDITVYGKGGHGAYPHTTVDPIVLASRMVLAFQTIVSRETSPTEPSVITVGAFHAGTKGNIISDEAKLKLTLRSYDQEVRDQSIAALQRVCDGIAMSAGLPEDKYPKITVRPESIPSTFNNVVLAGQVKTSFEKSLGKENVIEVPAVMGGEDFGLFGRTKENIPIHIYWLGVVEQKKYDESQKNGTTLPSLHSPFFAPDPEPSITTGVKSMSQLAIDLFNR